MTVIIEIPSTLLKERPMGVSPMLGPFPTNADRFFSEFQDEVQEWLNQQGYEPKILIEEMALEFPDVTSAIKFKLAMGQWSHLKHHGYGVNSVLLPLIRRVMPRLIAEDIIGAQPMTGPVNSIHTLRARYSTSNGDSDDQL